MHNLNPDTKCEHQLCSSCPRFYVQGAHRPYGSSKSDGVSHSCFWILYFCSIEVRKKGEKGISYSFLNHVVTEIRRRSLWQLVEHNFSQNIIRSVYNTIILFYVCTGSREQRYRFALFPSGVFLFHLLLVSR